jgi:hypothetical protein
MGPWILFFLEAVASQSRDSMVRARRLADLRRAYHERVDEAGSRSHNTHLLVDDLFEIPVLSVPTAMAVTKITYAAAKAHVMRLIHLGVLDGKPYTYKGVAYYFAGELHKAVEGPLE